ncbi:pyruvate formate-lyase-activating protein [Porphyromonas cangingivalis]|uniref:Pyruvate formate-lyase-activating enzyme n=1 Tax=Porphyromonas cangingivalis TaxID=36874 RepID=A0A1T4K181_PORCN|nr:pyruvate formate-lyase-activating protein [Porphyromonas cangingivalis]KGL49739.1 pyruvate formate lyase-activating enzyme 1 [Porphyromonas cangingivalis]SJZ36077.1 pyruvate formate lyase activating enzyme [Porphyromonas cangingivalis]VEJ03331.1 Pyruvate formate-lyase 1-activating enzyme [Porphyromonas cangingivalis]
MTENYPIRVHSFESMGTFDGPGLRLVVFLQGCNFKCLYCANPDTIPIGSGGKLIPIEEILRRAISEKPFFGKRGGVTFSGGEPTVQAKELIPLCRMLKANGIHICIDTNGSISNDHVRELISLVDMVLLDCKEFDPIRHKAITQRENTQVLKTAEYLASIGKPVRLRYVLVPGYTDFTEDLEAWGAHFSQYKNIDRVEVLPYHTYGKHKYESMGSEYLLEAVREPSPEEIDSAKAILSKYFDNVWSQ